MKKLSHAFSLVAVSAVCAGILLTQGLMQGCLPENPDGEDPTDAGDNNLPDPENDGGIVTPQSVFDVINCQDDDATFVEQATLAILGRRPYSQKEITQGIKEIQDAEKIYPQEGRRRFVLSLMEKPETQASYVARFTDLSLDNLYAPRTGNQSLETCYGDTGLYQNQHALVPVDIGDDRRPAPDSQKQQTQKNKKNIDVNLAEFVRDYHALDGYIVASEAAEFADQFTFLDLAQSSILLDDLSPLYRAHLYAMMTRLNGCGNVDPVEQELAYRDEIGHTFEAAYLGRDPVCLACHNSNVSVTDNPNPNDDRHWPRFGKFEESVFGSSSLSDPRVPRGVFRVGDFVNAGGGVGPPIDTLDGSLGYCYDMNIGTLYPSSCAADPNGDPNGRLIASCNAGDPVFCLSPIELPTCARDAEGNPPAEGTLAVCENAPFCVDGSFTNFSASSCVDGAVQCDDATFFVTCGDFVTAPFCDADGKPSCTIETPDLPDVGVDPVEDPTEEPREDPTEEPREDPTEEPREDPSEEPREEPVAEGLDPALFRPWGTVEACGTFARDVSSDDPAQVNTRFASLQGMQTTVLELEKSLKRGVESLARQGLVVEKDGTIKNPDAAFAYLVAMNIVDNVWREVMGNSLTISTRFPRNAAQQEMLTYLTDRFVTARFSLRQLLADIVTTPYFALKSPAQSCGTSAYPYPALLDPWVRAEPEVEKRGNGAGDAVHALSGRTLLSSAYAALGWPSPTNQAFPEGFFGGLDGDTTGLSEVEIQRGLGIFHGISEKGFRGLDFQAQLFFESRFGACQKPKTVLHDAIDVILENAYTKNQTTRQLIIAIKMRLINEPWILAGSEEEKALTDLFGNLDAPLHSNVNVPQHARMLCGALLASPQFQLTGIGQ